MKNTQNLYFRLLFHRRASFDYLIEIQINLLQNKKFKIEFVSYNNAIFQPSHTTDKIIRCPFLDNNVIDCSCPDVAT